MREQGRPTGEDQSFPIKRLGGETGRAGSIDVSTGEKVKNPAGTPGSVSRGELRAAQVVQSSLLNDLPRIMVFEPDPPGEKKWISAQDLADFAGAHPDEFGQGRVWHVSRQLFGAPGENVETELGSLVRSLEEGKLAERGLGKGSQAFLSAFIAHIRQQNAAEAEPSENM